MSAAASLGRADSAGAATLVDVLAQHRFDEPALWRYLEERLEGFAGPAELQQFQGGQSNPTFLISTPAQSLVLRKKPPGQLLPSAHLVEREFRVLRALASQRVPVPAARILCEDPSIIGTAFYVMDYVPGRVFTDVALPGLDRAARGALYEDFARVLAVIHRVDWRAAGLADFGKPERYVARQVDRWTRQYLASKSDDDPNMSRLIEWLRAHVPEADETALVHGDYRIGNLVIHPTEPRVVAVLDWELSTLGHPLSDLAYACLFYRFTPDQILGGLAGCDLGALGIPGEDEFVAAYRAHAERASPGDMKFFLAFAFFRSAAITQGVYARALQGNAADRRAIEHGRVATFAAELGWEIANGAA